MLKAYKFRIYPAKATECLLKKTFGCSRFVHNKLLFEIKNKTPKSTEKILKEKHNFLKEVDSIALQQSRINLETAFKNLQKGNANFPKFKSRKSRQSFRTISTNNNIKIDFENNTLKLPKISPIKFRDLRTFTSPIRQVTVSKDKTNKYFASILVEESKEVNPIETFTLANTVGLDMGIAHFVTLSDGTKIDNPKFLIEYQNKLRKAQRRFSKSKKGSRGRAKLRIQVARIHSKIANCRKDFLHKLSTLIVKKYDGICIEDLNMMGLLKNRKLSKSLQDLGWSMFADMLQYKALSSGKTLLKAGRFFPSSKLCHACHFKKVGLKLNDRVWTCPSCGLSHDRDINAALNLKSFFQSTLGTRGIYAGGDEVRLKPAVVLATQVHVGNASVLETRSSAL